MNKNVLILALITLMFIAFSTNCDAKKSILTTDEGVIINGICWATRNVDAPSTFAANPEDAGMFYQWNRKKGWNITDREVEGWDNSIPTGTEWEAENDPCPEGWRVPTREELQSLHSAVHIWATNWNDTGINGFLFGVAPHLLFLPVAGCRNDEGTLHFAGNWGFYWSNTQGHVTSWSWHLQINRGNTNVGIVNRASGFSVRCVAKN
jgi:uncharacterized protein (TIGR02145 family)